MSTLRKIHVGGFVPGTGAALSRWQMRWKYVQRYPLDETRKGVIRILYDDMKSSAGRSEPLTSTGRGLNAIDSDTGRP